MASLLPPEEAEPLRKAFLEETARVEGELEASKSARPRITLRTLDDLDGDFELQAKANGGSLGCLVPPWVFDGRPEVTTNAQSPFTNLTHRVGTVGVSLPGDPEAHGFGQGLRPPGRRRPTTISTSTSTSASRRRGPVGAAPIGSIWGMVPAAPPPSRSGSMARPSGSERAASPSAH